MLFEKQDWVLGKVLQKQSELNGDLPFIQFEDGPMHTYREAHELSNRVGNAFIQRNVAFGENVALMLIIAWNIYGAGLGLVELAPYQLQ